MPYTFEEVIQNEMIREHRKRPQPRYPIWVEGLKVFLMFMGAACMISYAAYIAAGYEAVPYTIAFCVQPWLTTYVRRKWNAVIKDLILAVIFAAWLLLAPNLATGFTALGYVILLTGYQIIRMGTPALPTAETTEMRIQRRIVGSVSEMPPFCITKSEVTRINAAQPFILIVQQIGRMKRATAGFA